MPSNEDLITDLEALFAAHDLAGAQALVASFAERDAPRHALGLAALAAHRKDADGCESAARQALALCPGDAAALQYLAVASLLRDRAADAVAPLRQAAATGSVRAQAFLGNVLLGLGRSREAEAAYQSVLAQDPGHVQALNGMGTARFRQSDLDGAVPFFARAFAARPGDAQPLNSLMNAYGDAGRALGALALLGLTRERHRDATSQVALALMQLHLTRMVLPSFPPPGEISDADEAVGDVLAAAQGQPLAVRLAAARALCDYGRAAEAEPLLQAPPTGLSASEHSDVLYTRGLWAAARGDRRAAIGAYGQAVQVDPRRWEAATNAITLLLDDEDGAGRLTAEAQAAIHSLLAQVPAAVRGTAPQLLYDEAVFLQRTGQAAAAREVAQRVLAATGGQGELGRLARELLSGQGQGSN